MRSWLMAAALGAAALVPADAQAFGGAYVGGEGVTATNQFGHIVYTRIGERSVVTLAPGIRVDAAEFGLVLPVPTAVTAEDVGTVDPNLLAALDEYSAPRLMGYTCDDLYPWGGDDTGPDTYYGYYGYYDYYEYDNPRERPLFGVNWGGGPWGQCGPMGCPRRREPRYDYWDYDYRWDTAAPPPEEPEEPAAADDVVGVAVVSTFVAGSYEITVLTAEESGALVEWLTGAGFAVAPGSEAAFAEYVSMGWHFVVARVSLEELPEDGALLPPLQVAYDTEAMILPLRIGTASASGAQDVVVHVLNDRGLGRAGVSNYEKSLLTEECLTAPDAEDFSDWYDAYAAGILEEGAPQDTDGELAVAGWAHEFSWHSGGCDPCGPRGELSVGTAEAFGWDTDLSLLYVTRMRVRYNAAGLDQDPVLVSTGVPNTLSLEFVDHLDELESDFLICGEGWAADAGSCLEDRSRRERSRRLPLQGSLAGTGLLLAFAMAWRRRSGR